MLQRNGLLNMIQLTIRHAETGFLQENECDDVWSLIFPTAQLPTIGSTA